MIRRPPRSTPLSLHDALPISNESVTEYHIVTVGAGGDTPQQFRVGGNVTLQVLAGLNPTVGYVLAVVAVDRSEEHTSELQSRLHLVCRLLLEKKTHAKT